MGGYVTESRPSSTEKFPWLGQTFRLSDGSLESQSQGEDLMDGAIPMQTTTSFRSGGDLEDETIFRGGTLGSSIQAIKTYDTERGSSWDNGHTFNTVKSEFHLSHAQTTLGEIPFGPFRTQRYTGPLLVLYNFNLPFAVVNPSTDLNAWGTRAIQRATPGNSPADVAQALIELRREGLPRLFGAASLRNRTQVARSAGEEYLNAEFGWRPLVRDLVDTMDAASRSEMIMDQFLRNSGTHVRRGWDFDPVTSNTFEQGTGTLCRISSGGGYANAWYNQNTAKWTKHTKSTRKVWFRGAFTYYAPPSLMVEGLRGATERANHLFGLELTPEVLWNIAPWTWLSDWIFNTGDVLSNLNSLQTDGTVMRYGYLMSEIDTTTTLTFRAVPHNPGTFPELVTSTFRTIRKQRTRATPYGFGLNPTSFTNRQWTILGALGLTRGNRSLRHNDVPGN